MNADALDYVISRYNSLSPEAKDCYRFCVTEKRKNVFIKMRFAFECASYLLDIYEKSKSENFAWCQIRGKKLQLELTTLCLRGIENYEI